METNDIGVQTTLVLDTNTVLALWMFRDPVLEPMRERLSAGPAGCFRARMRSRNPLRRWHGPAVSRRSPAQQAPLDAYRRRLANIASSRHAGRAAPSCRDRDDQKVPRIALASGVCALITRDPRPAFATQASIASSAIALLPSLCRRTGNNDMGI